MLRHFARLWRATEGLAAVEFAFLAPVMIVLFFGSVELSAAMDCRARVANVASTGADLVAQETTVSSADMANVFAALNQIIYPYPTGPVKVVISSLVDNGKGGATVAWSDSTSNTTARSKGSTVTVPTGLIVSGSGSSVILAEVSYAYSSPSTVYLTGAVTMTSSFYSHPRRSLTVLHS